MPLSVGSDSKVFKYIPSYNDPYVLSAEGPLARSNKPSTEVTTTSFDPCYELLWTGNAMGRISAYSTENGLKQIYSFNEAKAAIQHLDVYDDIIVAATADSLVGYKRNSHAYFRSLLPHFHDLKCVHRPATKENHIFVGGRQNALVMFDLETQMDIRVISDDSTPLTMMRSNMSNIFCADDRGFITIRSLTGEKLSEVQAHFGPITGFDICDNKLITAGCTIKSSYYNDPYGTPRSDPFLKVYDLRYISATQPISTPFPPWHIFNASAVDRGRIILTSQFGQIWSTNVNNPSITQSIHALPPYVQLRHATISSSTHVLAVVDTNQYGRLFATHSEITNCLGTVNRDSRPISPPSMDSNFFVPPYDHGNSSYNVGYWDPSMMSESGGPSSSNADFYGPPPAGHHRMNSSPMHHDSTYGMKHLSLNNYHHTDYHQSPSSFSRPPSKSRLISDARYLLKCANKGPYTIYAPQFFAQYESRSNWLGLPPWDRNGAEPQIPRLYSKPSDKDRHDKLVYQRFNNARQVALLRSSDAPIVNVVLRALSMVPLLKKAILGHLCPKPNCMLCEVQFVFRNMHLQERDNSIIPITCTAVVREMASYNDFATIKAIRPVSFSGLPLSLFCNFFFAHVLAGIPDQTDQVDFKKLLEVIRSTRKMCGSCGSRETTALSQLITHLDYSLSHGRQNVPFVRLLEESFNDNHTSSANGAVPCSKCYRIATRREDGSSITLPPILCIDTDMQKTGYSFWQHNADEFCYRPSNSMNDYDGRFTKDSSGSLLDINNSLNFHHQHSVHGISQAVRRDRWGHYLPSMLSATVDGNTGRVSFSASISKEPDRRVYTLCSVVMSVNDASDPERFIVACKNPNPENPILNWTIFNDYIVSAVKEQEALYTHSNWKLPHLLFYCDVEYMSCTAEPVSIPKDVFTCASLSRQATKYQHEHERVPPPEAGEIVALDSEFIQNDNKEHVLGRVSCLNKEGNIIIDDYALLGCNEHISDYLTQYSGIAENDLNPEASSKFLINRKNTYLKVLYLIENKNVFVGHALHNDFKILNAYVPTAQIIDTCELYRLEGRQFLSLRDLVKIVFGDSIQSDKHDSVEDALCALRLYNHFTSRQDEDVDMHSWLKSIYDETQRQSIMRPRYSPPTAFTSKPGLISAGYLPYI